LAVRHGGMRRAQARRDASPQSRPAPRSSSRRSQWRVPTCLADLTPFLPPPCLLAARVCPHQQHPHKHKRMKRHDECAAAGQQGQGVTQGSNCRVDTRQQLQESGLKESVSAKKCRPAAGRGRRAASSLGGAVASDDALPRPFDCTSTATGQHLGARAPPFASALHQAHECRSRTAQHRHAKTRLQSCDRQRHALWTRRVHMQRH